LGKLTVRQRLRSPSVEPCQTTQITCRLIDFEFENFTPTFLQQCRDLSNLPQRSPLITAALPQSQLRQMVNVVAKGIKNVILAKGLPKISTGLVPVFTLRTGENPVEAVNYVDGDGGVIVLEHFPGLHDYLNENDISVPLIKMQGHGYSLLPFREEGHDTPELGYTYTICQEELDSEVLLDTEHSGLLCTN